MTTIATGADVPSPSREARDVLSDLEQRVIDGDSSVTDAQLVKARQAAEVAEIRSRGVDAAEERAAAARVEAERDALRDRIDGPLTDELDELRGRYAAAVTALSEVRSLLASYTQHSTEASMEAIRLGMQPDDYGLPMSAQGVSLVPRFDEMMLTLAIDVQPDISGRTPHLLRPATEAS